MNVEWRTVWRRWLNGPVVFPSEPISPLKNQQAGDASQPSGGPFTSEGSSVGFKPVPKKRTFLSRRRSSQPETNGLGLDAQVGLAGIVPAPRRSLQRGSSGSSTPSCLRSQDEMPQTSVVPVSNQVPQPPSSTDETSQQPLPAICQVSSNPSLEKDRILSSITRDRSEVRSLQVFYPDIQLELVNTHFSFRSVTYIISDVSAERETPQKSEERDDQAQREHAGVNAVITNCSSIQDSDREHTSSVGTASRQEELSLPQSIVGEFSIRISIVCQDEAASKRSCELLNLKIWHFLLRLWHFEDFELEESWRES